MAVQPAGHEGIMTVCLVNPVETAPVGAFPQPALIPVRMPPVLPELEPLAAPEVAPLAPDVEPLVAPLVAPEAPAPLALTPDGAAPLVAPVPPTPLVVMPEPTNVPLGTLPLLFEPVTPPAPLVLTPEKPVPLVEPLPEPLAPAPLPEAELAPDPAPLSVGPLQATAVKRATHGNVRSQAFGFIGTLPFDKGLCAAG